MSFGACVQDVWGIQHQRPTPTLVQSQLCELCGGDHINGQCAFPVEAVEDVNYMTNQYRQGSYNQGWKPHPSIGREQSGQAGQTGQFNKQQQQPFLSGSLEDTLQRFLKNSDSTQKSIEESCKRMEMHFRCISQRLNDEVNTEVNLKEEGQIIITESDKILDEEKLEREEEKVERKEKEELSEKNKDEEKEKEVVEREERKKICVKIKKLKRKRKGKKKKMRGKKKKSYEKSHPHLKKNHGKEKKFKCFMEIFKKLEIKVPMIETLQQGLHLLMDVRRKSIYLRILCLYTPTDGCWEPIRGMFRMHLGQAKKESTSRKCR
ncbi:hypothetical protein LR48_Vigan02g083600 [Vigna angularis]|uniref:Uncharacterized protein n=1 Tax=Phaseolus angularis TaxID=3914 RepID=A0A0L9TW27_PHAAN|nr:hypothetical protein LR48_Vigan02g083600 [Vigna angularis]